MERNARRSDRPMASRRIAEEAAHTATTTAAGKVLAILDAFASDADHGLGTLALRAGVPKSTAHRILSELAAWGGAERRPNGGYRLGQRFLELGRLAGAQRLRERALPLMDDLRFVTGHRVTLIEMRSDEFVLLGVGPGDDPMSVEQVCAVDPVFMGRIIGLSRSADPHCGATAPAFVADRHPVTGKAMVAVPICEEGGDVIAALAISSSFQDEALHHFLPVLELSARTIARALQLSPAMS